MPTTIDDGVAIIVCARIDRIVPKDPESAMPDFCRAISTVGLSDLCSLGAIVLRISCRLFYTYILCKIYTLGSPKR